MNLFKNNHYRNYFLLMMEGICFSIGIVFFDTSTILPLLMNRFTDSSILVGLLGMAPGFSMGFTAILAGNYGRSLTYKKKFIVSVSSIGRLSLWFLGLMLIFVPLTHPTFWALLILIIQYNFWFVDGAVFTAWSDLFGKSISDDVRGRFMSVMQISSGILAIFAGRLISRIMGLEFLSFPQNYGVIISIGAFFFTISIIMFLMVREKKPSSTSKTDSPRELVRKLPAYFKKNKAFSRSMLTLFFCTLGTIALPFFITYAENVFSLAEAEVGGFVSLRIVGRIGGAFLFGILGDKLGHEQGIKVYAVSAAVPALLTLAINQSMSSRLILFSFWAVFLSIGIMQAGAWMTFMNYMIDLVDSGERTLFAGLFQLVRVPASIAPFLGGLIVNQGSYVIVFVLSAVFSIIGAYFAYALPAAERTKVDTELQQTSS